MVRTLLRSSLEVFFPFHCLICEKPLRDKSICMKCSPSWEQGSQGCYLGVYEGALKTLIKTAKYKPSSALMRLLASEFGMLFRGTEAVWDTIVPIPPSFQTYRQRLFHQTFILAKAAQKNIPYQIPIHESIRSVRSSRQQASLRLNQRIENVQNLFTARLPPGARHILLIDDVVTTGATSAAAARALLDAGAESVDLYCLARSRNWERFRYRIYNAFGV